MAFNDLYRLVVNQQFNGNRYANVIHFKQVDVAPGNLAQLLAEDFRDGIGPSWRACVTTSWQFVDVTVQRIIPYGDAPAVAPWAASTFGTRAITNGQPSNCLTVTLFTGFTGRRKRGRIYFSGFGNADAASGSWQSAAITPITTLMSTMYNRYDGSGIPNAYRIGVWSRVIGGQVPPFNTDGFSNVTSYRINNIVRNQRRRQLGVGS